MSFDRTKHICLWMSIYIYIYIYRERETVSLYHNIYIYIYIDCFVISQLFSVARHAGRFKLSGRQKLALNNHQRLPCHYIKFPSSKNFSISKMFFFFLVFFFIKQYDFYFKKGFPNNSVTHKQMKKSNIIMNCIYLFHQIPTLNISCKH